MSIIIKEKVKEYLKDLEINNVLDLGCGKGFKSLWLSRKGINVLGVDKRQFNIREENFKFIQEDINDFKIFENYGLIILSLVLHFLDKKKALEVLFNAQKNTIIGGYNFLVLFSDKELNEERLKDKFYPSLNEIKEIYNNWDILNWEEGETPIEEHCKLPPHNHKIILMLARKI